MAAALFLALLVTPLLEIFVIIQVGQVIGGWPTVTLLLLESLFGAWIVRREGRRAWTDLRTASAEGRLPSRELADGALLLLGGALLLAPGFITDALGFLLVIPPTRAVARRMLTAWLARRVTLLAGGPASAAGWAAMAAAGSGRGGPARRPRTAGDGEVVEGQVVEGQVVEDETADARTHRPDGWPRGGPAR